VIKVSDYVARFLVENGIADLFLVSGGGIMHLLDSVGSAPGLSYVCNYHEQACAIAAEGYARVRGGVGACLATVGPGAANLLSGALGAWYDSVPLICLSGQVRRDLIADYAKVRQVGPQEGNVVEMARPVTKYAKTVLDPTTIRWELERALHEATTGRPGPVWLEIPLDVQGSMVDEGAMPAFRAPSPPDRVRADEQARALLQELRRAKRPVLAVGNGIRGAARAVLARLLSRVRVPVVVPDMGKDLVPEDHPSYLGVFGPIGQRRANFAVQNSDLFVSLATGLCIKKIGFNHRTFAPRARKVFVDIDAGQLLAHPLKPDVALEADAGALMEALLEELGDDVLEAPSRWRDACLRWRARYPLVLPEYFADASHVNSYVFVDKLSDALSTSSWRATGSTPSATSRASGSRKGSARSPAATGERWAGTCRSRSARASAPGARGPSASPATGACNGTCRSS
jgi:acetolactate synthase I/II/III large subunit